MKPNFFIVGAPKCGTSSMYYYLKQHPDIFMSKLKEPHYFSMDLLSRTHDYRIKNINTYLKLFANVSNEKRIGEASASYLYSKVAAENIKEFNPNARIIIMLRNPCDAVCSMFKMLVSNTTENILDLEMALEAEIDRLKGISIPKYIRFNHLCCYKESVSYSKQIKRYYDVFDKKCVKIILLDDIKEDSGRVYKETLQFLEIQNKYLPNFEIRNASSAVRNLRVRRLLVTTPLFKKILVMVTNENIRHSIGNILSAYFDRNNRNIKPIIIDRTIIRLKNELKVEVEDLSRLLNRDLSHWII